jgi:hypothetical protein
MKIEELLKLDKDTLIALISQVAGRVRNTPDKSKYKALRETLLNACDLAGVPKPTDTQHATK